MMNTNTVENPFETSEQLKSYLETLRELRKDGAYKISQLEEEKFETKRNKKITDDERKEQLSKIEAELVNAKADAAEKKEQIKEIVVKATALANEEGKKYYTEIHTIEKAKIEELKKSKSDKIEAEKQAHLDRLAKIDKADKHAIADEKMSYDSHVFDIQKNFDDGLKKCKDAINDAYLARYNYLTKIKNDRHSIAEKFEYSYREYAYNFKLKNFLVSNALYAIILVFFLIAAIIGPITGKGNLLTIGKILTILEQSSTRIFFALGVAGLILLGGTDLSIGRMVGLGTVITAVLLHKGDNVIKIFGGPALNFDAWPVAVRVILALVLSIALCTFFSAIAGFFTAKFKMHPFISTLATQLIIFGFLMYATSGTASGPVDAAIKKPLAGRIGTFPILIIYAVLAIAIVWFIWNKTKFGKNMYAVGGNQEAAAVSGISVFWTTLGVFIMAGILYGCGSFLEALRLGQGSAPTGTGYELDAIAACVVGGISFSGGIGKIKGAVIGVIIFTGLTYVLGYLGIDTNLQFVIKGIIIMSAVALDCIKYLKKK